MGTAAQGETETEIESGQGVEIFETYLHVQKKEALLVLIIIAIIQDLMLALAIISALTDNATLPFQVTQPLA